MNDLSKLEEFLKQLLLTIQDVVTSGEVLTDEFQGLLADSLQSLTSRIDELKASEPSIPPLDKAIPSSVIEAFKYDPKNGNLLVQFKGKFPQEKGSIYSYSGVPPQIFNLFKKGAIPATTDGKNQWGKWWKGKKPSAGSSMHHLIKALGFPYQKLT